MTRRLVAFRQADVTRAVKGAIAAGLDVGQVECGADGKIVIKTKTGMTPADAGEAALAEWERQHG